MHNKNARSNLVMFLAGLCLIIPAAWLLLFPADDDTLNLRLISIVFIIVGLMYTLAFALNHRWYFRPGWTLQHSFFLIFFGILLIFSGNIEFETNMIIFAFFAFFLAAAQLAAAIQLYSLEIKRSRWIAVFGLVNIVFGAYFVIDPLAQFMTLIASAAVFMIVMGVMTLIEPLVYMKGSNIRGKREQDNREKRG